MVWQQWVFVAFNIFAMLLAVASIGKPRTPFTPASAVAMIVINGLLVALVVSI